MPRFRLQRMVFRVVSPRMVISPVISRGFSTRNIGRRSVFRYITIYNTSTCYIATRGYIDTRNITMRGVFARYIATRGMRYIAT